MSVPFPLIFSVFGILVLTILGWAVTHSPLVPYNVRELVRMDHPVLSIFLLSAALYWICGAPVWFARRLSGRRRGPWVFPAFALLHGLGTWILLRSSVPMESIHDIVGSPVLGWPWEWELIGRFLALFSLVSLALTGGAVAAVALHVNGGGKPLLHWLAAAAVVFPLWHAVVVTWAATDNLTELMAGGGGPAASLFILLFLLIVSLAGSLLAAGLGGRDRWAGLIGLVWTALSFPVAYLAISYGTESAVVKYGRTFSALQFLLSSDRASLAIGWSLFLRFFTAWAAATALLVLVQAPLFRGLSRSR